MAKVEIIIKALTLISLLGLLSTTFSSERAGATLEEAKWCRVNTPAEGETGGWVLASGSDVRLLTRAIDGTLYCYANPSGTSYTLFRSIDAGYSWSHSGKVTETIVAIAASPDQADVIYYATVSRVYKSNNAGNSFTALPLVPGGAGSNNVEITTIAITRVGSNSIVAVGTRDADDAQYGGVYILDENEAVADWSDTNTGNYDILAVAFSPNFTADYQLLAVVTDEVDTLVTSNIDNTGWGKVLGDATIEGVAATSAVVAFPDDYDATTEDYTLFVGIDTDNDSGDVYLINGMWAPAVSMAIDLDIGSSYNLDSVDINGLAAGGNTAAVCLLAGAANGTHVYMSTDSGLNWVRSRKEPTGQSGTGVLMAPDFTSSGIAYAVTTGQESALARTTDGGDSWNQIGLIDTRISENGIIGLAVSPDYGQDNTLFLLTFDGEHLEHSLWRSRNGGASWERVFTSSLAEADSINRIELSPEYGGGSKAVFMAGTSGGDSVIWKSADNGQTFRRRGAPFPIDVWRVVDNDTLLLGSYDGSNGLVYRTTNSGLSYSVGMAAGNQPLHSMVLSPQYEQDETILVGNANGWVYWSEDNGMSFRLLGQRLPLSSTALGQVSVAFDPEFSSSKVVYAASGVEVTTESKERIYRFIIGRSDTWESINGGLPMGSLLSQLVVSTSGVLYATNSQLVDAAEENGGMERSLNPTYSLGPTFETVSRGLDDDATLTELWPRGNQLWSIDTKNTRLMNYIDSLTLPVILTSPSDKAPGIATRHVTLDWKSLKGATKYQWQLDYDTDFSTVPAEFEGDTDESSARSPVLEMATTYYWRVRVSRPVLSPWSAKWSFTTSLGTTVIAPELYSPEAGAGEVSIEPVFQWSAIAGADSYELLVATEAAFASPVIMRTADYALPATAWQSDISLDYGTTYYWKVRASGSGSYSAWSAVGAFITESPPSQSPPASEPPPSPSGKVASSPPPQPPPSASPAQPTFPDWVIYLTTALLLTVTLLLIAVLVLVVRMRRS